MIGRYGDPHVVVSEGQRKFAPPEKLLILPPLVVRVQRHTGVELGDGVEVVIVFLEVLRARASAPVHQPVIDIIPVLNGEGDLLPGFQGLRQFHPHHRFLDVKGHVFPSGIAYVIDIEPSLEGGLQAG